MDCWIKISDFSLDKLNTETTFKFSGSITFHGKTKILENETMRITASDGGLEVTGNFKVNVADFDIEIPKIVSNKLSRDVSVNYEFVLNKR